MSSRIIHQIKMEEYKHLKREHLKLFSQYHRWYAHAHEKKQTSESICRDLSIKYKSFKHAPNNKDRKRALYKELRTLRRKRTLAWRRYRNRKRFNVFRLAFFNQTNVCAEFCRHHVEQYL